MVNNINGQSSPMGFIASAVFDPENMKVRISLSGVIQDGIRQSMITSSGSTSTNMTVIYGLDDFDGKVPNFPSFAEGALDNAFGISKMSRQAVKVATPYALVTYGSDIVKIECDPISCTPPIDPTVARSMSAAKEPQDPLPTRELP
jgi:hypothetical protein